MRLVGALLLTAGFLAGAYVSVARVGSVDWTYYGVSVGLMVAGMVVLRRDRAAALERAGDVHAADVEILRQTLASLRNRVQALEAASSDQEQLAVHHRIDDELMEDINTFVESRESMIPRFGMQRYADTMSPFANAERLLNRAWSASADGYVDEVRSCIRGARAELEKAAELLGSED